jgi:hypothetical protein
MKHNTQMAKWEETRRRSFGKTETGSLAAHTKCKHQGKQMAYIYIYIKKKKSKAIPVTGLGGL